MTRLPLTNVIRHSVLYTVDGEWCLNEIHVKHSAAITQAMVDADRAVLRAWLVGSWRQVSLPQAAVSEIRSRDLTTSPPTRFAVDNVYPTTVIVGLASGGGYSPRGVCPCISLRTGTVGQLPKPQSGHVYHVAYDPQYPSPRYDVSGSYIAAAITSLTGVWEALRAAFTNTGNVGQWVVPSYHLGGSRAVPNPRTPPVALPVTHIQVAPRPTLLNSRKPRQQAYTYN